MGGLCLGGKYVFATLMCILFAYVYLDQLKFCVVCVDCRGYVNIC